MTDYSDIIERLEKADGPDRELDRAIHDSAGLPMEKRVHLGRVWNEYTTSLDAAIALVERMLPGHFLDIGMRPGWRGKPVPPVADIYDIDSSDMDHLPIEGATPAVAVILAMFRALQAQEESEAA